ncbi:MAG: hypothetical protein ACE5DX_01085 [Candidatus Dojkabacteria bacterium]
MQTNNKGAITAVSLNDLIDLKSTWQSVSGERKTEGIPDYAKKVSLYERTMDHVMKGLSARNAPATQEFDFGTLAFAGGVQPRDLQIAVMTLSQWIDHMALKSAVTPASQIMSLLKDWAFVKDEFKEEVKKHEAMLKQQIGTLTLKQPSLVPGLYQKEAKLQQYTSISNIEEYERLLALAVRPYTNQPNTLVPMTPAQREALTILSGIYGTLKAQQQEHQKDVEIDTEQINALFKNLNQRYFLDKQRKGLRKRLKRRMKEFDALAKHIDQTSDYIDKLKVEVENLEQQAQSLTGQNDPASQTTLVQATTQLQAKATDMQNQLDQIKKYAQELENIRRDIRTIQNHLSMLG